MGIRNHKEMGWGLNNIVTDEKGKVIDPRIDTDFFQSEDYWEKYDDIVGFITYLEENKEECEKVLNKIEPPTFPKRGNEDIHRTNINWILKFWEEDKKRYNTSPLTYDSEFGDGKILLISSIEEPEWSRFDDCIDYYEAKDNLNHIQDLTNKCGIYPYLGVNHIPGSPKFEEEGYPNFLSPSHYNQRIGEWDKNIPPMIKDKEKLEYYKKYYRPVIPATIVLWVYWIGIFKYFNKTIQELRPMIYTYWA